VCEQPICVSHLATLSERRRSLKWRTLDEFERPPNLRCLLARQSVQKAHIPRGVEDWGEQSPRKQGTTQAPRHW